MFQEFLNSLKRPENTSLIEAIHRGYNACFENKTDLEIEKEMAKKEKRTKPYIGNDPKDHNFISPWAEKNPDNYHIVWIDTKKFDDIWKTDPMNITKDNPLHNRYEKFKDFWLYNKDIEVPFVYIGKPAHNDYKETVGFTDGRHRYAYMKDIGMKSIPMLLDNETLKYAKENGFVTQPINLIESPTAEVTVNGHSKYVDFHVEDVIAIEGEEKALEYVTNILKSLVITNKPIEINEKYLRGEEISKLLNPKGSFTNRVDRTVIISHLRMIKENLEEKLGKYDPSLKEKIEEYV